MSSANQCRKAYLCNFKVIGEHNDAQVEICTQCGKKVIYPKHKETGRIDTRTYLEDHRRDFVQPYGRTAQDFIRVYGHNEKTYRELWKAHQEKEQKKQDYQEMMKESKDFVKKKII